MPVVRKGHTNRRRTMTGVELNLRTGVDLFAGMGGFSEGATAAGLDVLWAANHWPAAVAVHAQNHPRTKHLIQDLHEADWTQVPAHDVLMASPACQGHSRARGKDRPHHDAARNTAWAVVNAAEVLRPPVIICENVPEWTSWVLMPAWRMALEALGYSLADHIVDAADHGVPQHRVRVFIVATLSRKPLHLKLPQRPHQPADSIIQWDAGRWSPVDKPGRAQATLERIRAGRAEHGPRHLISYYGNSKNGRSIHRPVGTITTRDRHAIIDGDRMRMLSADECRAAMGFRPDYQLPRTHREAVFMLGNAVAPPVATDVINAVRIQA